MNPFLPTLADVAKLTGASRMVGEAPKSLRRAAWDRAYRERNREALRAYDRAYYHAKIKGKKPPQVRSPEKRRAAARALYWRNVEAKRAEAVARYHENHERYKRAARDRARVNRAKVRDLVEQA